jgi:hypothetical protein
MHASSNRPFSLQEKTSMLVQTDQMVQLWLLTRKTERIENNLNLILKKQEEATRMVAQAGLFFKKKMKTSMLVQTDRMVQVWLPGPKVFTICRSLLSLCMRQGQNRHFTLISYHQAAPHQQQGRI